MLEQVIKKNIFFIGFFDLKSSEFYEIDSENISSHIRKDLSSDSDLEWDTINHLLNKNITVPYECALYQPHQKRQSRIPQKENVEDDPELKVKIAAAPIPKTTYQKPKERPKSQMAKTQPQPFNITATNTNIPTVE